MRERPDDALVVDCVFLLSTFETVNEKRAHFVRWF
jgi:hypothetical protein